MRNSQIGEEYMMSRTFNITADCKPSLHYMVDLSGRLEQIKKMVDAGQYFTINRARQYGKSLFRSSPSKNGQGKFHAGKDQR